MAWSAWGHIRSQVSATPPRPTIRMESSFCHYSAISYRNGYTPESGNGRTFDKNYHTPHNHPETRLSSNSPRGIQYCRHGLRIRHLSLQWKAFPESNGNRWRLGFARLSKRSRDDFSP